MKSGQTVVGTTKLRITQAGNADLHLHAPGAAEAVPNTGIVFVGGEDVTTTTGFPLIPGQTANIYGPNQGELWAISDTAGQVLSWLAS